MHLATRPPPARILHIDRAIRANTWPNAQTLANQLEVNEREIRRGITHLRDRLGAPLEFDPVRNGYVNSEPSYRLPFFQLTEGELVALLLAGRLLGSYRGTPFEQDLQRAFARLSELLPEAVTVRLDALSDCLAVLPETRADYDPEILSALAAAIVGQPRVVARRRVNDAVPLAPPPTRGRLVEPLEGQSLVGAEHVDRGDGLRPAVGVSPSHDRAGRVQLAQGGQAAPELHQDKPALLRGELSAPEEQPEHPRQAGSFVLHRSILRYVSNSTSTPVSRSGRVAGPVTPAAG